MKKRPLSGDYAKQLGEDIASRLQGGLPAVPLVSHSGVITAIINDLGSDLIFAQQTIALGKKGDVIIGISTSGNAKNVVNAFRVAKTVGMKTIALTGQEKSKMSEIADVSIRVPKTATPDVQELHLPVYHIICAEVEEYFYSKQ